MEGQARRISYQALSNGVPVRASGGEEVGTVEHVLQVPELDVFDGIVVKTSGGLRFADASQVDPTGRSSTPARRSPALVILADAGATPGADALREVVRQAP